jgi:hypothetical protein
MTNAPLLSLYSEVHLRCELHVICPSCLPDLLSFIFQSSYCTGVTGLAAATVIIGIQDAWQMIKGIRSQVHCIRVFNSGEELRSEVHRQH